MADSSGQHLNFWRQRLGHVPACVRDQTDIETLVLADNNLEELPEWIGNLARLRMLDLGHWHLTDLPD